MLFIKAIFIFAATIGFNCKFASSDTDWAKKFAKEGGLSQDMGAVQVLFALIGMLLPAIITVPIAIWSMAFIKADDLGEKIIESYRQAKESRGK